MHKIDDALFAMIRDRIVQAVDPERVILFGSHVTGQANEHSDVDIFVEMISDENPHERRMRIRRLFADRWWPMDVLVYTPDEVRERRDSLISIVPEIEREGRILYCRNGL